MEALASVTALTCAKRLRKVYYVPCLFCSSEHAVSCERPPGTNVTADLLRSRKDLTSSFT